MLGEPPAAPAAPAEPATPVVPEAYEFAAPEIDGKAVEVDPAALDAFKVTAKELGLTQDQFQGVTRAGLERITDLAKQPYVTWANQQSAWQSEIKADPEIGGDKLAPALADAAKALDAFGTPGLRQALAFTGAGNHPEIVRAFVRIGRAMGESAGLMTGKPAVGTKPSTAEEVARGMYGPTVYPTAAS